MYIAIHVDRSINHRSFGILLSYITPYTFLVVIFIHLVCFSSTHILYQYHHIHTTSETQVVMLSSPATTVSNLNTAIFRNAAAESFGNKAISLFPGVGYGAAYKILQRVYKFGGQPVVLDYMTKKYGADFDERFGHKTGRTLLSATSGSLIGIGEGK